MTLEKYLELAPRTMMPNLSREERIIYCCRYGIPGEFGEIVELLKKVRFHGHELDRDKLIEECGDLLWYVANLAIEIGDVDGFLCLRSQIRITTHFIDCENSDESKSLAIASDAFSACVRDAELDTPVESSLTFANAMAGVVRLIAFLIATGRLPGTPEEVLDRITDANDEKRNVRYPDGFSEERSRERDR